MALPEFVKQKLRDTLSPGMRGALNQVRFEMAAGRIARAAQRSFAALKGRRNLKLHLGAGDDIRLGWVNTDLRLRVPPHIDPKSQPDTVFINHDLRRGLPLDDGSVDLVYSSHFFEHLSFEEGLALMRESHRVLAAGGRFRIALPTFKAMFQAYLDADDRYFDTLALEDIYPHAPHGTLTRIDHVNYGVYQHGEHRAIYDEPKTIALLKAAGFGDPRPVPFDKGIDPDNELRRRYTFYVDAYK